MVMVRVRVGFKILCYIIVCCKVDGNKTFPNVRILVLIYSTFLRLKLFFSFFVGYLHLYAHNSF
jgi:hypothetical protein